MSEVKNPILSYADQYRTEAGRGQKMADIWSVVTDLERNIAPPWDAQRLRADTAEAERDVLKYDCQVANSVINAQKSDLAAAEQRIAELLQICRDIQDDPRLWLMVNAELSGRIIAALNPNPEAESHE